MKLLIQNGRVLDPVSKTVTLTDLLAENGRVALLERGLETEADRIIDASGLVVSPGLVDMHVHLRDPGYTYKEDIRTGTAAAAGEGSPPWPVWPTRTRCWTARSSCTMCGSGPRRGAASTSTPSRRCPWG